jgi:hypothetical protein
MVYSFNNFITPTVAPKSRMANMATSADDFTVDHHTQSNQQNVFAPHYGFERCNAAHDEHQRGGEFRCQMQGDPPGFGLQFRYTARHDEEYPQRDHDKADYDSVPGGEFHCFYPFVIDRL